MYKSEITKLKEDISKLEYMISKFEVDYESKKNKGTGFGISSKAIALGTALNELDFQLDEKNGELEKLLRKQKKFDKREAEKKLPKLF